MTAQTCRYICMISRKYFSFKMQDKKPHKSINFLSDSSGIPMIVAFFPMDSSGMESFLLLLRFSFLLPINVGWISPSHHTGPAEHRGTVEICPNHLKQKSMYALCSVFVFLRKKCLVNTGSPLLTQFSNNTVF